MKSTIFVSKEEANKEMVSNVNILSTMISSAIDTAIK